MEKGNAEKLDDALKMITLEQFNLKDEHWIGIESPSEMKKPV